MAETRKVRVKKLANSPEMWKNIYPHASVHAESVDEGQVFRLSRKGIVVIARRVNLRHVAAVLLLLLLAVAAPAAGEEAPQPISDGTVRVGDIAPDFDLTTLDGKQMRLKNMAGKNATIVAFWSFFCFPCQSEMPELQEFMDGVKGDVTLAAIALDGPQYNKYVLPYVAEKKLRYPIAYDRENERFFEVAEKYGVIGTPTIFVLDQQGRIRFIHLGKIDKTVLGAIVEGVKSKSFCSDIVKPPKE